LGSKQGFNVAHSKVGKLRVAPEKVKVRRAMLYGGEVVESPSFYVKLSPEFIWGISTNKTDDLAVCACSGGKGPEKLEL